MVFLGSTPSNRIKLMLSGVEGVTYIPTRVDKKLSEAVESTDQNFLFIQRRTSRFTVT